MKYSLPLVMTFVIALCLQSVTGQTDGGLSQEVLENIRSRVDNGPYVSISIGYYDGKESYFFSYGKRSIKGDQPVDEHTVYEIGSISKTFTGILLADMVNRGLVQLDDPAQRHLPAGVKMPEKDGQAILLKHLANHTSALPRLPGNLKPADMANPYADYTVEQMYQFLSKHKLRRPIGAQYEYSNLAAGLLGHILALKNESTFEELMLERIAKPLDLHHTAIQLNESMQANFATGHNFGLEVGNWDFLTLAGAGAIRSNTVDLLKFTIANLKPVDTELSRAMQLSHQIIPADSPGQPPVGLGWHLSGSSERKFLFHNGSTGGYHSFAGFIPEGNKAAVVLTNCTESTDDIGFHLLDPEFRLKPLELKTAIDQEVLETYLGKYELASNFIITVTRRKSQLFIQATGQPKFEVYPSSETEFFLKAVDAQVTFNRDDTGKVISLTLHQGGQNSNAPKLQP